MFPRARPALARTRGFLSLRADISAGTAGDAAAPSETERVGGPRARSGGAALEGEGSSSGTASWGALLPAASKSAEPSTDGLRARRRDDRPREGSPGRPRLRRVRRRRLVPERGPVEAAGIVPSEPPAPGRPSSRRGAGEILRLVRPARRTARPFHSDAWSRQTRGHRPGSPSIRASPPDRRPAPRTARFSSERTLRPSLEREVRVSAQREKPAVWERPPSPRAREIPPGGGGPPAPAGRRPGAFVAAAAPRGRLGDATPPAQGARPGAV